MVALWCTIGLIIATFCVSTLGAAFSVVGVGALFSGAKLAVWAMAGSLEFAKFVLAAYLHQRWPRLNKVFKVYLTSSVIILSAITSMGIFGFLSDAYQSASSALEAENIKLASLQTQKTGFSNEILRLNQSIDEIPANRISKRIEARKEVEPEVARLVKRVEQVEAEISQSNLRILEVKQKVGPLIYIARAFNMDIDMIVKYLILLFVIVFDPLAICLVVASSEALQSRKNGNQEESTTQSESSPTGPTSISEPSSEDAEIIQMRFSDDKNRSSG